MGLELAKTTIITRRTEIASKCIFRDIKLYLQISTIRVTGINSHRKEKENSKTIESLDERKKKKTVMSQRSLGRSNGTSTYKNVPLREQTLRF